MKIRYVTDVEENPDMLAGEDCEPDHDLDVDAFEDEQDEDGDA